MIQEHVLVLYVNFSIFKSLRETRRGTWRHVIMENDVLPNDGHAISLNLKLSNIGKMRHWQI